jgi:hypothetical protein
MKRKVTNPLALGFFLLFSCFILMPNDTLAGDAAGNPAVKQVDVARIDNEDQGRLTIVKVEVNADPAALGDAIASLELRDANGDTYPFSAEEFHSTDDGDFYLKWLPFWLPGNTAVLIVRDVEGIEHEFPADQPPAGSTPQERAMAGDWSGTTNQAGGYVNFTVSGTNVVNFQIRMYVCWTGCTWVLSTVFTIPVSGNSFSYSSYNLDLTGTFTSQTTATGTWDYHDMYFGGYGKGTWQADISADDPPEINSIDHQDCLSELCTTLISVSATDPEGGALTYEWVELNGPGGLLSSDSGASVVFDPPDAGPHPCPYQVMVTVTSDVSGLSVSETIDIYVKNSGDVTGDGVVNVSDLNAIRDNFMQSGDPGWIDADLNCDGWINVNDLNLVRDNFMSAGGCVCP